MQNGTSANQQLRTDRLEFYEEDVEKIDRVLAEFLRLSGAKCALLVDKEGHLVTRKGELKNLNMDTISALVAGSFAATKEMARLLGEDEFSALFHQGSTDNIQLTLVGDRTLLTIIFDDKTTVGMVRLYSTETAKRLVEIFSTASERQASGKGPKMVVKEGYQEGAMDRLDAIFGSPNEDS